MQGIVIKNTGSLFVVKTAEGHLYDCKIKGNFRIKGIRTTNPIAVGDIVNFKLSDDGPAWIYEIEERKNYIIRKSPNLSKESQILAANLDLVVLVATINYPETSTVFIDRFLAGAEAYEIPACIIVNKMDCYDESEKEYANALKTLYENIGYPVFLISAINNQDYVALKELLRDKTTLISGNSGVGKSTMINHLIPHLNLKTQHISDYHQSGMHTTTFSEMFDLPNGGAVIDTPGIKGFGTIHMETDEISHYFKDIFKFSEKCRYNNCTHTHEPNCAVLDAVDKHYISKSRYHSYLNMLEESKDEKYR